MTGTDATSTSTSTSTSTAADTGAGVTDTPLTTGPMLFDMGGRGDVGVGQCSACEITLTTTGTNALHTINDGSLLAQAVVDGSNSVFGIATAGAGRLAFSGDANILYLEGSCPLWPWLGATDGPPRVLCFGADWPCHGYLKNDPKDIAINGLGKYPGVLQYGGQTLPGQYAVDPAALRKDFDLVVYIAANDYATNTWSYEAGDGATLESFVRDHGGGLYLVGEYWGAMGEPHLMSLNAFSAPFGVEFEQLYLKPAPTEVLADIECFPEPG